MEKEEQDRIVMAARIVLLRHGSVSEKLTINRTLKSKGITLPKIRKEAGLFKG